MARDEPPAVRARPATRRLFAPQSPRPLRPDAASDHHRYRAWAAARERWRLEHAPAPVTGPELAVVVLAPGESGDALAATVGSVQAQTSPRWHLSLIVLGEPAQAVDEIVASALAAHPGGAALYQRGEDADPADAFSAALEEISSPACLFLDAGDVLAPDAVARLSDALVDADVAYGDEDRVGHDGLAYGPVLKPDWSPELLRTWCYTGRPVALRVAPVVSAGGIRRLGDGDWEHDLVLRVTERTQRITHVAEVLCHRMDATAVPRAPRGPGALVAALDRRSERADVEPGPLEATWSLRWRVPRRPGVSAIVPFRDNAQLLRACLESVLASTGDVDLEVVLVDNGSTEPETETLLERASAVPGVVVRRDDRPFNWAAINNAAAAVTHGEVLLFLNDDVEARSPGWLTALAAQALRPEVGAVGARLVYPSGEVQHAGIVIGLCGVTGHVLAGLAPDRPGYLGMAVRTRDVSAVTGACMATRRDVFEHAGGFDEVLGLDFNDVDYCLRVRSRGLRVVYEARAELVHHESPSRGTSGNVETTRAFLERWGDLVAAGDPFYNRNLSRLDFSAALDEAPDGEGWR